MSKSLPIQKVSFRGAVDRFLTEGGGSNKLPKWVTNELIIENSKRVSEQLSSFSTVFAEEHRTLPLLVKVSIDSNATSKSRRSNIRQMLDVDNKRNVVGADSVGTLIAKIDSRHDLEKIKSRFSSDVKFASKNKLLGMASIRSIECYSSLVEDGIEEGDCLKVQLIDYQNNEYNHISQIQLESLCDEYGLNLEELHYASNLRLFSINDIKSVALERIATMDGVIDVRKMPMVTFEAAPEPDNSDIPVMCPVDGEDYPVVGLLDTGVGDIDHLRQWMYGIEDNAADLLEPYISRRHGTAVAGVINYGDQLECSHMTGGRPCMIQSCIVNTDRTFISERELVRNVQHAVLAHPEIKIWNLSQGLNKAISGDRYSHFAMALDSLQKNNRILICKSAGNDTTCIPLRITEGADSLLSLVVGSIAHKKTSHRDAEVGDRSPFSRIGPGVENVIKPDIMHYGGNLDSHMSLFSEWGRQYSLESGTSFATPRITALAANLQRKIGGDCNPLLLKALLVHYSCYPSLLQKTPEELRKEMGFGLPCVIDDMLTNDEDECTMVFSHVLKKGEDVVSLDFPYPTTLVDNGKFIGEITVTMAVNPILDASQGSEYCQSQVDVLLQTYDHVEHVRLNENTFMRNENRTSKDAMNVLNESLYCKSAFKSKYANERLRIEQGDKFQPIKKYVVDLSKMKDSPKEKYLDCNRKWALKLNGLYRDSSEQSMIRDGDLLSQEVVVVITIKDPLHRGIVYADCLHLLEDRGYVHSDISVHNDVEIDVE